LASLANKVSKDIVKLLEEAYKVTNRYMVITYEAQLKKIKGFRHTFSRREARRVLNLATTVDATALTKPLLGARTGQGRRMTSSPIPFSRDTLSTD